MENLFVTLPIFLVSEGSKIALTVLRCSVSLWGVTNHLTFICKYLPPYYLFVFNLDSIRCYRIETTALSLKNAWKQDIDLWHQTHRCEKHTDHQQQDTDRVFNALEMETCLHTQSVLNGFILPDAPRLLFSVKAANDHGQKSKALKPVAAHQGAQYSSMPGYMPMKVNGMLKDTIMD